MAIERIVETRVFVGSSFFKELPMDLQRHLLAFLLGKNLVYSIYFTLPLWLDVFPFSVIRPDHDLVLEQMTNRTLTEEARLLWK